MSDSLWPRELQLARLPCPSLSPGYCSYSCPLSQWCHPTLSSSVIPFSWLQSFPASGSFPVSQLFASGGQRIGASASASVSPMNIQEWFPLVWTGLISLLSKGLSRDFSNSTVQKHQFFGAQLYTRCSECFHLINGCLYPWTSIFQFPSPPAPGSHCSPLCFYEFICHFLIVFFSAKMLFPWAQEAATADVRKNCAH